jgi:regulator of PEP synthase PpsR (kinase-PPPase family)
LDKSIRQIIDGSQCFMIDIFATFLAPLEQELATQSSYTVGKHRTIQDYQSYNQRIKAVNFSLASDDGLRTQDYEQADLILIGVSRSGKTPTCLYLALQFGLQAANYPLTEEDLSLHRLPHSLLTHKAKLFGLTIDPQRLRSIRSERRANSRYAALAQCQKEVKAAEGLLKQERIPYINTTQLSVEEIASQILAITGARN